MKSTDVKDLPSVKKVIDRLQNVTDNSNTYQGVEVIHCEAALSFYAKHSGTYTDSVLKCLCDRLKYQQGDEDITLFNSALRILATHGWSKTDDASFGYEAIEYLAKRFILPLQNANANCALLQQEWEDIVFYAKQYINLCKDPYLVVWWKLFNAPDSKKWKNILSLVELIFVLPLSNGSVEQCFSQMKIIKTNRRTALGEDRLDDCL